MPHRHVRAGLALLVAAIAPREVRAQDLPVPTEWRTHYAWFLVADPDYVPRSKSAEEVLTLLRAGTREEAQALADADPAVRAGRLVARVREWWVPAEQLP